MEEIKVPMNIREEFDTSKINVGMNTVEAEVGDAPIYADDPYVPEQAETTVNVAERIRETSTYYDEEKGYVAKEVK